MCDGMEILSHSETRPETYKKPSQRYSVLIADDPRKRITTSHPSHRAFFERIIDDKCIVAYKAKQPVFSQGDSSNAVFYIQEGKIKLTVVSERGRQAIIGVLETDHFLGEQCLADEMFREVTATAVEDSSLIRITRTRMLEILREDPESSLNFISCLLTRNTRLQEDLVDHFLHRSERRLARLLLSLAHHEDADRTELTLPKINQETLAEMVGTTRGRVSYFMNKFRAKGFVDYHGAYNGRLQVHKSLLDSIRGDRAHLTNRNRKVG
jgi:CRP/FNR family transcriptional regulator, cyclic AMP receptor protein